jgi:hypothetical protein
MSSRGRISSLLALALAAALGLSACGDSHSKVTGGTYAGESGANAPYLDVGPLVYQPQLSRELNPYDIEDASYLAGLTPAQRALSPSQEWFAVFLQVFNNGSKASPASTNLTLRDTRGNVYSPVLPNQSNLYAFRGGQVPAEGRLPLPDSTAAFGPTQGALLLYKIQIASLSNRPLQFTIVNPGDAAQKATAELDV